LETWTDIEGSYVTDLMSGTNNFAIAPNVTERLGHLLEVESFVGENYGLRIHMLPAIFFPIKRLVFLSFSAIGTDRTCGWSALLL